MKTYAESGDRVNLVIAAGCSVGEPLIIGDLNCVAETSAAAGFIATVKTTGVYWLSVKGIDDAGNKAVAAGDQVFFVAADTPKLSKKTAGAFFGWALDPVYASDTATIRVLLGGAGVGSLDFPSIVSPGLVFAPTSHDYAGAHADWVLSAAGVLAVGTITLTGVPLTGEGFTIGPQKFWFRTAAANTNDITIGATAAATCTATITCINTLIPKVVTASQGAGTTVVITAVDPGVNGNAIVFTEACTLFAMDGSGVLGGTTAGVDRIHSSYNVLRVTNTDQAANIVALPADGKVYWVQNATGFAIVIKASGQTGITIATTKKAMVMGNGNDFERWTADI